MIKCLYPNHTCYLAYPLFFFQHGSSILLNDCSKRITCKRPGVIAVEKGCGENTMCAVHGGNRRCVCRNGSLNGICRSKLIRVRSLYQLHFLSAIPENSRIWEIMVLLNKGIVHLFSLVDARIHSIIFEKYFISYKNTYHQYSVLSLTFKEIIYSTIKRQFCFFFFFLIPLSCWKCKTKLILHEVKQVVLHWVIQ